MLTASGCRRAVHRLPSLLRPPIACSAMVVEVELAASSGVAVEAAVARPGRHTAGGGRGAAPRWSAGAGGIGCRAGGAGAAHQIAQWGGGRRLSRGRLIKTWAMRGTLHLLTPEEGGAFLSLMASGRVVGATQLAEVFRGQPRSDRVTGRGGAPGSRRPGPHPGGARRDSNPRSQARPRRGGACLRVGYVAQTARLAGRPRLRTTAQEP